MTRETQVLIIGAGTGGYPAAIRAAQLGKQVLVVEKSESLGGVCLNVGCIPSKALIHAAETVKEIREAEAMGITVKDVAVDLKVLQDWKGGVVEALTKGVGQLFKANGVEVLQGTARFTGANQVEVDTGDGTETVAFEDCIVATGSSPVEIPGFAFDHEGVIDSTDALALTEVPKDLVIIGGGFIGLEIGNVYSILGSKVTVVEMMDQILPGQDADLVRVIARSLQKRGVEILTGTRAKGVKKVKGGLHVTVQGADGKDLKLPATKVLVAVGRRPNTGGVAFEAAGVELNERGFVKVDEQRRTTNPHVFATGDIVPGPMLAHRATKEGTVAAAVIAGKPETYDVRAMPWAVFTDPEMATVGLSEEKARGEGYDVVTGRFPFTASGRARGTNATEGFVKIVADKETDLLLGVHIVGADASNLISEAALAIEMGAFVEDIGLTVHVHPTLGEAMMEAAEAVHKQAIHIVNR